MRKAHNTTPVPNRWRSSLFTRSQIKELEKEEGNLDSTVPVDFTEDSDDDSWISLFSVTSSDTEAEEFLPPEAFRFRDENSLTFSTPSEQDFRPKLCSTRIQLDICPKLCSTRIQPDICPKLCSTRIQPDIYPKLCSTRIQPDICPKLCSTRIQPDICPELSTTRIQDNHVGIQFKNSERVAAQLGNVNTDHLELSSIRIPHVNTDLPELSSIRIPKNPEGIHFEHAEQFSTIKGNTLDAIHFNPVCTSTKTETEILPLVNEDYIDCPRWIDFENKDIMDREVSEESVSSVLDEYFSIMTEEELENISELTEDKASSERNFYFSSSQDPHLSENPDDIHFGHPEQSSTKKRKKKASGRSRTRGRKVKHSDKDAAFKEYGEYLRTLPICPLSFRGKKTSTAVKSLQDLSGGKKKTSGRSRTRGRKVKHSDEDAKFKEYGEYLRTLPICPLSLQKGKPSSQVQSLQDLSGGETGSSKQQSPVVGL